MDLKSKKESLRKSIATAKELHGEIQTKKEKIAKEKESLAKEFEQINKTMTHGGENKMVTKQIKSHLFALKLMAEHKGVDPKDLAKKYFEEKAVDGFQTTADHAEIMNNVKLSDLELKFNSADKDLALLNRFTRKDLLGKGKLEWYEMDNNFKAKKVPEGKIAPQASWGETPLSIVTSRVALSIPLTAELEAKSIVDQAAYIESQVALLVARAQMELFANGQGANAGQQDNGYTADGDGIGEAGLIAPGVRAVLSSNSLVEDFGGSKVTNAKMQLLFKKAGARFKQKMSSYVIITTDTPHEQISNLVSAVDPAVTGVNPALSAPYAERYRTLEVYNMSGFLTDMGYKINGFKGATSSTFGIVLLIDPSQVFIALDSLTVESERSAKRNAREVTVNAQIGQAFKVTSGGNSMLGAMAVNIIA